MKGLEHAMREEFRSESRDMGVSVSTYKAMWKAAYEFISNVCEPSPKLVKDSLRLVGNFARTVELCKLHEREDYSEQVMQAKFSMDSEGLRSTEIGVVSKEASRPPLLPSLFHPPRIRSLAVRVCLALMSRLEYLSYYGGYAAA